MAPMDAVWLYLVKRYVVFAHHFVAPTHPHPIGVLLVFVLATTVKNFLKRRTIQLDIH